MDSRRKRATPEPAPIELPDIEDDGDDAQDLRDAVQLLDVPEWVDPETGERADDEQTRLEDH